MTILWPHASRTVPLGTGVVHELKCWPDYFEVVQSGIKPFEVRSEADRTFNVGDLLRIREWRPLPDGGGEYTGRECGRRVSYILRGFPGIEKGYVVLGFPPGSL